MKSVHHQLCPFCAHPKPRHGPCSTCASPARVMALRASVATDAKLKERCMRSRAEPVAAAKATERAPGELRVGDVVRLRRNSQLHWVGARMRLVRFDVMHWEAKLIDALPTASGGVAFPVGAPAFFEGSKLELVEPAK